MFWNVLVIFLLAPVTFYYLKKLRKWILYSVLPWFGIYFLVITGIAVSSDESLKADSMSFQIVILGLFLLTNILLTVSWTNEWNEHLNDPEPGNPESKSPAIMLKERYVKGEITKQEYDQIKQDITE